MRLLVPENFVELLMEFENFNPEVKLSVGSKSSVNTALEQHKKVLDVFEDLRSLKEFIESRRHYWSRSNLISEYLVDYELFYSHFPCESSPKDSSFDYFTMKIR